MRMARTSRDRAASASLNKDSMRLAAIPGLDDSASQNATSSAPNAACSPAFGVPREATSARISDKTGRTKSDRTVLVALGGGEGTAGAGTPAPPLPFTAEAVAVHFLLPGPAGG